MTLFPLIFIAAIVAVTIWLGKKIRKFNADVRELQKLPALPRLPLIGGLHYLIGSPEEIFDNIRIGMKRYYPICVFWIANIPTVNITKPEDIEIVISTTKNSTKGFFYKYLQDWMGTGLLTSHGEKWHTRRKILTPSFHFSILQQFIQVFEDHAEKLIVTLKENIKDNNVIDTTQYLPTFTLHSICETSMGISLSDGDESNREYVKNVKRFADIVVDRILNPMNAIGPFYFFSKLRANINKVCGHLHAFSSKIITEREKTFAKSDILNIDENAIEDDVSFIPRKKKLAMLDILLSAKHRDGSIDFEGIREEVDTFVFEGHDTTGTSLCLSLMLLANNRECQDKAYEEIISVLDDRPVNYNDLNNLKYLERCIKESLRIYPSVPLISRISDGFVTSDGYHIPKASWINILIHVYDTHRIPSIWPNPEKFDPDRFLPENVAKRHPYAYIPFSAGPRNCIGQRYAMLEMKTGLVAILRNFVLEPVDTPKDVRFHNDLVLRTRKGINVKLIPRNQ